MPSTDSTADQPPRPAGPDAARDARRRMYAEGMRRAASRALDRYLTRWLDEDPEEEPVTSLSEQFVESMGDYVEARLQHNCHYVVVNDDEEGRHFQAQFPSVFKVTHDVISDGTDYVRVRHVHEKDSDEDWCCTVCNAEQCPFCKQWFPDEETFQAHNSSAGHE
jgi:hypothetical protein